MNQAYDRTEKIRRYKEQKELESQLGNMYTALSSSSHIEDEQRRKCFKTFLRYWTNKSIDDSKIVNDEIGLLESFGGDSSHHTESASASAAPRPPHPGGAQQKPYILTRDAVQAQVFGAGYPSLPVYSISQFYDQLADRGLMPKAGTGGHSHSHDAAATCCATRDGKNDFFFI